MDGFLTTGSRNVGQTLEDEYGTLVVVVVVVVVGELFGGKSLLCFFRNHVRFRIYHTNMCVRHKTTTRVSSSGF